MIAAGISEHVDHILGKPFQLYARGPHAYYCLGVFLDLLERATGMRLEDPFTAVPCSVGTFWKGFLELPTLGDLQPLDVLFRHHGEGQAHVSVVENENWAVTAEDPVGVVRNRLADEIRRAQRAYRLKALL